MPDKYRYDYAVVRVVPKVDREEFINAGVILSCPDLSFLEARINLNEARLRALDPNVDLDLVKHHLAAIPIICRGGEEAGSIGQLPLSTEHDNSNVSGPYRQVPRSGRRTGTPSGNNG